MSITYPEPQKANPYPKPVLGPTPELRARAAIDEAIGHFQSVARSGGLIGIILGILVSSNNDVEVNWMFLALVTLFVVSMSLSWSTIDFRSASERAKFLSGVGNDDFKSKCLKGLHLAAIITAIGCALGGAFFHKEVGLSRSDGMDLFAIVFITSQLISILIDTLQGAKLLRFAQSVKGESTGLQA